MVGRSNEGPAIGIDLGTTYSCVAVWKHGRIEIIPNDQGNRTTPSVVAFANAERFIGDGAKNQLAMNPANTIFGAESLINRSYSRRCTANKDGYLVATSTYLLLQREHGKNNLRTKELAIGQHRSSLHAGSVDIYQWKGHTAGIDRCKMKMGLLLTGESGKVMCLWSVERYKCLAEYHLPHTGSLTDFNFDESKVVGLVASQICIWRHNEKRSIFSSQGGQFPRGTCMCYVDPEAVVGCEDGRARVFDMYGKKWSRIIKRYEF